MGRLGEEEPALDEEPAREAGHGCDGEQPAAPGPAPNPADGGRSRHEDDVSRPRTAAINFYFRFGEY